ncbi:M3 family metallopeptidase [Candidatus Blochmannia ocreatus (nom. nud.)]|uniref:oligopeptidase A n=1 Tax=Candidatus Blochmannia ocreatus (nom. nud.) TaxID=251538 RepID=A0ABY4SUU9_9ENTR|nr:M3 family metallopeptidase [Candidatus Blochmannia ocreatus]URJ25117.1 M3 family metallopeptidase [Candidatus Blochmannia ocreatus]
MKCNPLLKDSVLPLFSSISPEHVAEAMQTVLNNCYSTVERIVSTQDVSWNTVYYPLMIAENALQRTWSLIAHLNSVSNNLKWRKVYEDNVLFISEYKTWISQHFGLYTVYQILRNHDTYPYLNIMQKKVLNNAINNFRYSGVTLSKSKKKRYLHIQSELSKLSFNYANNVFDATASWSKLISEKTKLSGIPDQQLEIASLEAKNRGHKGWIFTLQYPSYSSVLLYCDNRELREEMYWAFNTRASDQGPDRGQWDNTLIIDAILTLRHESAKILGFNNYFEKSLVNRMVRYPEQVFNFLTYLYKKIYHNGYQEFIEIENFAKKKYSCMSLKPWDVLYFREKQKKYLFSIDHEKLRFYFPENIVLNGIFTIVNCIYGISIKERYNIETWHPDVRFFDIFDNLGEWKGGFYLDLYHRDNKFEGAWMDDLVSFMYYKDDPVNQKPIACLICSFDPVRRGTNTYFFTHNNIVTLFHEFGHVLHHIMTCINIPEISGIRGIPWDLIELPSQLMEKFCWESDILQLISMNFETKRSLSNATINNLLKTKLFFSSSDLLHQIMYGLFDARIHYEYIPGKSGQVLKIFNEVRKKILAHSNAMDWERFPHSFLHIFSNDYAAGYYSYLLSDVLASNVWMRFKKLGILHPSIGKLFFNDILSIGSVINLEKCLMDFCGHEITVESILEHYNVPTHKVVYNKYK